MLGRYRRASDDKVNDGFWRTRDAGMVSRFDLPAGLGVFGLRSGLGPLDATLDEGYGGGGTRVIGYR